MKKQSVKKQSRSSLLRKRRLILEWIGAALIAAILFWGLFHVNSIEVVGNSGKNYTDQEIIEMTLPEFWTRNSALLRILRRKADLQDVRFMESVEVEVKNRNEIRLHVNEQKAVGFVRLNDVDFYFDHNGIVLEIMSAEETAQLKLESAEGVQETEVQSESEESAEIGEIASEESAEADENELEAVKENIQEFNPDLADVPLVTGLEVSPVEEGQRLPVSDSVIFNTIQSLTKMIDKYKIYPDYVLITENEKNEKEMSLYYGTVRAALGTDSDLEEKITRLAAILPKLTERSGVLHLEEFTGDTINIVFEED
ncbi:MAG: hypothetical protein Q4B03_02520 [Lachnospiraceae bacterium]|nr:hypothetical protein [Lachnospiraceae bacterium]